MLQRAIALPDYELTVFVSALRTCGMIADETGNLLPALSSQMHRELLSENDNPMQFERLQAVLAFQEIDVCIHGRGIRGEALRSLAELVRANTCESVVTVRELLTGRVDLQVYRRLLDECASLLALVKRVEQTSRHPPPGTWWWTHQYYNPIAVFDSLGRGAMRAAESAHGKRAWWRFW
jgi:hypothetical protein